MAKRKQLIAGVFGVALAVLMLSASQTASAESYRVTASGWDVPTSVDNNNDGATVWRTTVFGKDKFGKSVTHTNREAVFAGFGFACGELPADVFALKLHIVMNGAVTRYENGDMLFSSLDTNGPPGVICIGFSSLGNWYGANMIIDGGTGRFEGATGWYSITADLTPFPRPTGEFSQNGVELKSSGEIFLAMPLAGDDDDDSDD